MLQFGTSHQKLLTRGGRSTTSTTNSSSKSAIVPTSQPMSIINTPQVFKNLPPAPSPFTIVTAIKPSEKPLIKTVQASGSKSGKSFSSRLTTPIWKLLNPVDNEQIKAYSQTPPGSHSTATPPTQGQPKVPNAVVIFVENLIWAVLEGFWVIIGGLLSNWSKITPGKSLRSILNEKKVEIGKTKARFIASRWIAAELDLTLPRRKMDLDAIKGEFI